jgi:hypothetical protein
VTPDIAIDRLLPHSQHALPQLPNQERLDQTIKELRFQQLPTFREVLRLPPKPDQPRVRLTHTRKFWSGLEKMSQYWDCSRDNYYEVPNTGEENSPDTEMSDPNTFQSQDPTPILPGERKTKHVYKGFRISNGAAMPPSHREETISALLEMVVWPFNCQVRTPSLPPRLSVKSLCFPVRQSCIVGRVPKERDLARKGVLEGPVLGACCRPETSFHVSNDESGENRAKGEEWREVLDLSREVAVLLLLAQERAREMQKEVKPGEEKWWTSKPRWGGGPGGPIENDTPAVLSDTHLRDEKKPSSKALEMSASNEAAIDDFPTPEEQETPAPRRPPFPQVLTSKRKASGDLPLPCDDAAGLQHKRGSKLSLAEKWKTLKPGPGVWDKRMRYRRIGQSAPHIPTDDKGRVYDQIFMLSSINHHVAILCMSVSDQYLKWLAGDSPEGGVLEEKLDVKRTRWFDLFSEDDRVELVQGLWKIMAWLMREDGQR